MLLHPKKAAENEMKKREVSSEPLTIDDCQTLRRHHSSKMIKGVNVEVSLIKLFA